jgi:hypothetical protein
MSVIQKVNPLDVTVILIRVEGEDVNSNPLDFTNELATDGCEVQFAKRNPATPEGAEWLQTVLTSAAAASLLSAVVQVIVYWKNGHNGRRYRIRQGDCDFDAPSIEDRKKFMRPGNEQKRPSISSCLGVTNED